MSGSQVHEMDELASNGGSDMDEETGLTAKELRRKRQANQPNGFIPNGTPSTTAEAKRLADKHVVRKLVVNLVLIGLWYLFSLSISIYNKWMFSPENLDFHFPLFTTSLHMFVQFLLSVLVLLLVPSLRPKAPPAPPQLDPSLPTPQPKPLLTPMFYLTRLVPCGTTTSLDIGLGNTSLRYITLTFYTMCKSSVLIFVLLFAFLFGLESPTWRLTLIITTMTLGVLMMVFGETTFNALGLGLALSASFFSGFRWALTQLLLLRHPVTGNPFSTLFLLSPIMFVSLLTLALAFEGASAVIAALALLSAQHSVLYTAALMLFPGLLAFCMIAAEFTLLQRTNVVTLSICGIFKEVLTIAAAEVVFHDYLTLVNFAGLVVTIASIAAYNYLKIGKMRREARAAAAEAVLDAERGGEREGLVRAAGRGELGAEDFEIENAFDGFDGSADEDEDEHGDGDLAAGATGRTQGRITPVPPG